MVYWILLVILIFMVCYVVANRETIIMEHLENKAVTSGPMTSLSGPVPASGSTDTNKQCADLKSARDSSDPLRKAMYQAAVDQGKVPESCKDMLNDPTDVAALTSKLTALQQEVDAMKNQAKDQSSQAAAAQASLQAIH